MSMVHTCYSADDVNIKLHPGGTRMVLQGNVPAHAFQKGLADEATFQMQTTSGNYSSKYNMTSLKKADLMPCNSLCFLRLFNSLGLFESKSVH